MTFLKKRLSIVMLIVLIFLAFMAIGTYDEMTSIDGDQPSDNSYAVENPKGEYEKKLKDLKSLPAVHKKAKSELNELNTGYGQASEQAEIKKYLNWLFSIPWLTIDKTEIDLAKTKEILDREHQGMERIKQHILEYLAVQKRVPNSKAPILCFVGPPGVGKTTIAKSIAEATGRKFVRIPLGGIRDEANIRGHMRTYIGSKPGDIIKALKEAGSMNPVILLDEIDKVGAGGGWTGDPSAALLEVLDPAQNSDFKDHYIELGVDLSKVMFIATANDLDAIPLPLLDRLEIIELSSYTADEKLVIAKTKLIPKQMIENGLSAKEFEITDEAIKQLIDGYTVEAGVRQLNRAIGTLCRKAVTEISKGKTDHINVTPEVLLKLLGTPMILKDKPLQNDAVGLAQGLAWSPIGGSVTAIEALVLPGNGKIMMTGNLGEMSQESITAALSVARKLLPDYNMDPLFLDKKDVHVHAPTAVKKDGNSAGITITTAIISAITNKPIRKDVCMTGEINLHGDVLPIGGLKEKLIGAHRLGLKIAIIPEGNIPNLEDVPQKVKDELQIIPVKNISEVLKIALVK